MLTGDRVVLRTRLDSDVPVLHAGLYDDIGTRVLVSARPWQPLPVSQSPFLPDPADDAERRAVFTVADLASDAPIGDAVLWGIDSHNRLGHLGMSLLPAWRGRGCAGDVVRLLCRYGFQIRGLHRLQLETLSDQRRDDSYGAGRRVPTGGRAARQRLGDGSVRGRGYFRPACRRVEPLTGCPGTRQRCSASSSRIAGGTGRCRACSAAT